MPLRPRSRLWPVKIRSIFLMFVVYIAAFGVARAQSPSAGRDGAADSTDPKVFCTTLKKTVLQANGLEIPIYQITSLKLLACVPNAHSPEWTVRKSRWSTEDQAEWQRFIRQIGESGCNTTEKCLKDPEANTLWSPSDAQMLFYTDCADLPYFLRAYFSLKRGLPFSLVSHYKTKTLTPEIQDMQAQSRQNLIAKFQENPEKLEDRLSNFEKLLGDTRLSWNGNYPVRRYSVPSEKAEERRTFSSVLWKIRDLVSTGTFRMFETPGKVRSDFYSPVIRPESIIPGTVLYKPAGHVAIVYKVGTDGVVHFFDAHPDNSISRGQFNRDYARTNPNKGGGFKNWRPFVLMQQQTDSSGQSRWGEARPDSSGRIQQGTFRYLSDAEMTYRSDLKGCTPRDPRFPCDYSDEQYRGTEALPENDYRQAIFQVNGRTVDEFDYIRFQLSRGKPINPVQAFRTEIRALCEDLKGRQNSVQAAVDAGLDRRSHPGVYPANIYGAFGEWEDYSTPGRDLRIRARIGSLVNQARHFLSMIMKGDPTYSYQSTQGMQSKLVALKDDFLSVYAEEAESCEVQYRNSSGQNVSLGFEQALSRVSKMAFDPYLCIERRWGATSREELSSCREDENKQEWYRLTQFLRNRTERDSAEVMGYSLADLRQMQKEQQIDNRVVVDRFNLGQMLQDLLGSAGGDDFDGFDPLQPRGPQERRLSQRRAESAPESPLALSSGGRCLGSFCISSRVYHRRHHWEGQIIAVNAQSQSVVVRFGDSVDAFDSTVSLRDLTLL